MDDDKAAQNVVSGHITSLTEFPAVGNSTSMKKQCHTAKSTVKTYCESISQLFGIYCIDIFLDNFLI